MDTEKKPCSQGQSVSYFRRSEAARLCLSQALAELATPNSKQYPRIVGLIVKAQSLFEKAGHQSEADAEIIRVRETYRRRPALMAEMDRAGL